MDTGTAYTHAPASPDPLYLEQEIIFPYNWNTNLHALVCAVLGRARLAEKLGMAYLPFRGHCAWFSASVHPSVIKNWG